MAGKENLPLLAPNSKRPCVCAHRRWLALAVILVIVLGVSISVAVAFNDKAVTPDSFQCQTAVSLLNDAEFSGLVLTPASSLYSNYSWSSNPRFDARPCVLVMPRDTQDASWAVGQFFTHGVPVRMRGGGHSYSGYSTWAGVQIHMGLMNDIALLDDASPIHDVTLSDGSGTIAARGKGDLPPAGRLIRIQAGTLWYNVYKHLDGTGLVTPGGLCPTVGVMGYVLGGGFNHLLSRHLGLAADNVVDYTMVLANGTVVTVTADAYPDLSFALRGGGGGNFGLVTEITMRTYDVGHRLPLLHAEYYGLDSEGIGQLVTLWNQWTRTADGESRLGSSCDVYNHPAGGNVSIQVVWSAGMVELGEFEMWTTLWLDWTLGLGLPAMVRHLNMSWLEYETEFWGWGIMDDMENPGPLPMRSYFASAFVDDVSHPVVESLANGTFLYATAYWEMGAVHSPANESALPTHHNYLVCCDWAVAEASQDAGAKVQADAWKEAIFPLNVTRSSYVNYIDGELDDWFTRYYGVHASRLVTVKQTWDPTNFWNFPQSIPLSMPVH